MQPGNPVQTLGQPPGCQHPAGVIDDLDIVMVLGPVISHEQHRASRIDSDTVSSVEETASDLMAKCSPQHTGHVIPAAISPPHDQRAHGLPQDLRGQMSGVLTRRPLPEPSLPKRPDKCH